VLIGDLDAGENFIESKVDISVPIHLILQSFGGFAIKTLSP
jgi:hypothetical protein